MINKQNELSVRQQCEMLDINRSNIYYKSVKCSLDDGLKQGIIEIYTQHPAYGYRRIHNQLTRIGYNVNIKRVRRLMRELNIVAIYPKPRTTIVDKAALKYPYLLKDLEITRSHQVWQVDITHLRTNKGFMYLVAIIDVYSRYVVGYNLSNSLDTESCMLALERAILSHGNPEIINSDQGSQFTSGMWLNQLKEYGIKVSMTGVGRSNDNAYIERLWRTLKYEWLIIYGVRSVDDLRAHLQKFLCWYNHERPHQSLDYQTPIEALNGYGHEEFVDNLLTAKRVDKSMDKMESKLSYILPADLPTLYPQTS